MTTQKSNNFKYVETGVFLYTIIYFFLLFKDSIFSNDYTSLSAFIGDNLYLPLTFISIGIGYGLVKKAIEKNLFNTLLSNRNLVMMISISVAIAAWIVFIF